MKLGEILLELGWLAPEQLNLVIANRDGPAARLGTQLVEKGLLTTDQVSEALSRQLRLPAALQRHFDKADARVVSLLKPELAARFMAIPLVATRSGITRIVVAMATPQDVQLLDNLSFALGARVEPMVAAELAIARNLKRLCNLEVKPPMTLAPDQRPLYLPRANAQASALAPGVPWPRHSTRPMGVPALGVATILPPPPSATVTLEDVLHRLSVAFNRDQVADIAIDFMLPRFGCGLIFRVRGANAQVWRGYAPAVEAPAIETIAFPLSVPSVFRATQQRRVTFRGAPPPEGAYLHAQIWKYLRSAAPADIVVIPVAIGERVVCMVYAHAPDGSKLPDAQVGELQAVCTGMASALVRMIQLSKEGQATG